MTEATDPLRAALTEAVERGFIGGESSLDEHVAHSRAFLPLLPDDGSIVDLGTGGGLPGVVLAAARPDLRWTFLEASQKRADFLRSVVDQFGLDVEVLTERAEEVGRSGRRASWDAATARAFGRPGVLAECAAPLLRGDGTLIVSEPPGAPERWPADGLARLGLELDRQVPGPPSFVVLRRRGPVSETYPRRVGVPAKRPLF